MNKALYADLFPGRAAAAFSNIVMASCFSSAATFFIEPSTFVVETPDGEGRFSKAIPLGAFSFSLLSIVCYLAAEFIHRRRPTSRESRESRVCE